MPNLPINKLNIAKAFYLLFLASLFFPLRFVFPTKDAFETGAYSDFTSISLYLSDIFLFLTLLFLFLPRGIASLPRGEGIPPRGEIDISRGRIAFLLKNKPLSLFIFCFWLILGLFWHFKTLSEINWWFFFKYLELIVAYGTTAYLFRETSIKTTFLKVFVFFSSFQSILAISQFFAQKSIGLQKIGEQVLSPSILGIAKIVSSGTTYIRGYGTFPHPNLLSAFLCVSLIICLHLLVSSRKPIEKISYLALLIINAVGLTVTFSRAGFLGAGVAILIFFGLFSWKNWQSNIKTILYSLLIMALLGLGLILIFKPFLESRATVSDQASLERIFYAKTAWQMIKHQPIFGVGIGESVIHMQQYTQIKLWPWQIQPVHNYFILATAELGFPGAIILLWIFFAHIKIIILNLKKEFSEYSFLLLAIFLPFLILMQFDHYFYTLQQTQMLLWIFLGIILSQQKTPQTREL
ncbi:MAG: O-antigen ligase family protein [Candidatus Doudnabacteria bacterium]|nr:O-antigen ligase family protein [Candidatus Doudnabacteria bacterium]